MNGYAVPHRLVERKKGQGVVQNAVRETFFDVAGELTGALCEAFTVGPDSQSRIKIRL